jgi:ABC-type multidrug transport system fused ATPase/permease subunit
LSNETPANESNSDFDAFKKGRQRGESLSS